MRVLTAALLLVCVACGPVPGPTSTMGSFGLTPTPTSAVASASPSAEPTATLRPAPMPSPSPKPIAEMLAQIDPAKLDDHLRALTSFQSRHPLHPGHAKAVAYLMEQLSAIPGVVVQQIPTSYNGVRLDNIFATINPLAGSGAEGFLGGAGMICAHYDSTANRTPGWNPATDPAPGADDNATGTAALLEYARILAADRASLRMPIVLAFFDGEEYFFKGSLAYLQSLPPPNPYRWVINIDMVGFNPLADRLDLVYYTSKSASLRDRVKEANQRYQIGVSPLVEQLATSDAFILDAAPFGLIGGIPSVALVQRYGEIDATFPGNFTFHTVNDTPDKVTNKRLWLKAAKLTLATALELARGGAPL
ncbi:MAG TPA: M28 family peptidase [Candidatus Limnocylindria bacterium]|nr:M28 family peptidase [Candidatus Limnocylindria bacterium]